MSDVSITVSGGGDPTSVELTIEDFEPTQGDCIAAAQLVRSFILRNTEQGKDYEGRAFAGYNKTRPFYFYPNGPVGKKRSHSELRVAKAGVRRFAKRVGRTKAAVTDSGLGIRFNSYDDFKRTYLGRSYVDLRGHRAGHMLQQLVCRAGGIELTGNERDPGESEVPEHEFTIGIYGDAGERAEGINSTRRPKGMPRREFLNTTPDTNAYLERTLTGRATRRAQRILDGR